MKSRTNMLGDVSLDLSANEAETLLAELRIVRNSNEDEFGAVSSRVIDELESCIDEEEDDDADWGEVENGDEEDTDEED